MAPYSQRCPYVGVRQELRTALVQFVHPLFSASEGLLSVHARAAPTIHTWKLHTIQPLPFITGQGEAQLKELWFRGKNPPPDICFVISMEAIPGVRLVCEKL